MSEEEKRLKEGQRQCLACRNWVSVLATKCHHCGETLGRHRKEEETKTIEDLGGVTNNQYTVSGNVMDALEAFRAENISAQEEQQRHREDMSKSWFGKRRFDSQGQPDAEGGFDSSGQPIREMPDLDEHHQALADSVLSGQGSHIPSKAKKPKSQNPISPDHVRYAAIVVGVILVAVFGYQFAWPAYQAYVEEQNAPPPVTYENRALAILEAGTPSIEALEEAHQAIEYAPNEENEAILEQVREVFVADMNGLLNARSYSESNLKQASETITRAAKVDRSPSVSQLQEDIKMEVAAHKFLLTNVDANAKSATFKLNNAFFDENEQTLGVGELLQERFVVTAIAEGSVRLEDTKRKPGGRQRPLVSRPFQAVKAP